MFERVPVTEARLSGLCADFGEARVCFDAGRARRVPRTLPRGLVPPEGFRCGHAAGRRMCEDRARNGSPFECGSSRCLQWQPRMPDDGEWECVEMSGLPFCHSRGAMAGLARGPRDLGWLCGRRRGSVADEQICIDTDPDRPRDERYRDCRYEQRMGSSLRSCTIAAAPIIGDACDPSTRCPDDSDCRAGLCLPRRLEPACWLDRDCGPGARCALGSCLSEGA